jgi:hypothetical protein
MAWEKGRYYTRSRRRNGRVIREYIGTGNLAVLAAQLDAVERVKRAQESEARRAHQAALDALDAPLRQLSAPPAPTGSTACSANPPKGSKEARRPDTRPLTWRRNKPKGACGT